MSESTYTFILTEPERAALAKVLGLLVSRLISAPTALAGATAKPVDVASGTDHARAILSPPPAAQSTAPTASPIALRDRWARDRAGNELPNPAGCEAVTVRIWKVERKTPRTTGVNKAPFLAVTWYAPSGNGYVDANCFDEQLFPWITIQSKQPSALLYVVKNGKYLNVVGVRA